jgi:cytochrome c oxidase subunit 3
MSEPTFDELQYALPIGSPGRRSGGWWGMLALIATEGALFVYLIFIYLYMGSQSTTAWPPDGKPELAIPAANTLVLLASSGFVWLGERSVRHGQKRPGAIAIAIGIALGTLFVGVQLHEWAGKSYGITTHLYGSLYFTITGFHMAHVVAGLVMLTVLLAWTCLGYFDKKRSAALQIGALYWHFVDVVWLLIFTALYLTPYLA